MRVISGSAGSRRLRAPDGVRPTADRVRQALFDMLGGVAGARVLDLFAGSGALGIEALSRGAREAVFVDSSRAACDVILQNLETTGLRGGATIRRADAVRWVARKAKDPFDLVFLDPPYDLGLGFVARVLRRLVDGGWVRAGGTVVVEGEPGAPEWPPGLRETRTRRFGRTQIYLAVCGEQPDGSLPGDV